MARFGSLVSMIAGVIVRSAGEGSTYNTVTVTIGSSGGSTSKCVDRAEFDSTPNWISCCKDAGNMGWRIPKDAWPDEFEITVVDNAKVCARRLDQNAQGRVDPWSLDLKIECRIGTPALDEEKDCTSCARAGSQQVPELKHDEFCARAIGCPVEGGCFSQKKQDASIVCPHGKCTNALCCEGDKSCNTHACEGGYQLKENSADIKCNGDCDTQTCCEKSCNTYTNCEWGFKLKEHTACNGDCDAQTCCEKSCKWWWHLCKGVGMVQQPTEKLCSENPNPADKKDCSAEYCCEPTTCGNAYGERWAFSKCTDTIQWLDVTGTQPSGPPPGLQPGPGPLRDDPLNINCPCEDTTSIWTGEEIRTCTCDKKTCCAYPKFCSSHTCVSGPKSILRPKKDAANIGCEGECETDRCCEQCEDTTDFKDSRGNLCSHYNDDPSNCGHPDASATGSAPQGTTETPLQACCVCRLYPTVVVTFGQSSSSSECVDRADAKVMSCCKDAGNMGWRINGDWAHAPDEFEITVDTTNSQVCAKRLDMDSAWTMNLQVECRLRSTPEAPELNQKTECCSSKPDQNDFCKNPVGHCPVVGGCFTQKKQDASIMCPHGHCTNAICCEGDKHCNSHACEWGYQLKENSADIKCNGDCDTETCCEKSCKWWWHLCKGVGMVQQLTEKLCSENSNPADKKDCSAEYCCEPTTCGNAYGEDWAFSKCSDTIQWLDVTGPKPSGPPPGLQPGLFPLKKNPKEILCLSGTCDLQTCCENQKCDTHTCPSSMNPIFDKDNAIECNSTKCDDKTCCQDPPAETDWANKIFVITTLVGMMALFF